MRAIRVAFLPVVAVVAFVSSACSGDEEGTAQPGADPSEASVPASSSSSNSSAMPGGDASLADLDPCSVLTTEQVRQHADVKKPENSDVGGALTCTWHAQPVENSAALTPTVAVAIRDNGGVNSLGDLGEGIQHVSEGGREYSRTQGYGNCAIAIGVTDNSRVDVMVTGSQTNADACRIANSLTEAAEPKVPRG